MLVLENCAKENTVMGKWTTSMMLILLAASLVIGGCGSNDEYWLTLNVSGQGVTAPNTGTHKYKQGETTVIRARANNGWKFDNWSGDVSGTNATMAIKMDRDKRITANFSRVSHILNIVASGPGTVNPAPGKHVYDEGTVVDLVATPSSGAEFVGWSGTVSSMTSTLTTATVNSDMTVTASFRMLPIIFETRAFQVVPDEPINVLFPYHFDTGDRLEFIFHIMGETPVSYTVIRPDNAVTLAFDIEADFGAGYVIVEIPGEYRIQFSAPDTASVVLSSKVYPAP